MQIRAKKKQTKLKMIIAVGGLLLLALVVVAVFYLVEQSKIVVYINGLPVYKEEFLVNAEQVQQGTRARLINARNDDSVEFHWSDSFGTETGYQRWIDDTITYTKQIKVVQDEAQKKGLIKKTDYPSIKAEGKQENQERAKKLASNEPVYGLKEYTAAQYYDYVYQNLRLKLRTAMTDDNQFQVSAEEQVQIYEENKELFAEDASEKEIDEGTTNLGIASKFDTYLQEKCETATVKIKDRGDLEKLLKDKFTS